MEETVMRARNRTSTLAGALALGAIAIGAAGLATVAAPAEPASAADQIVFELQPTEEGICSFSGFLGQTFTPDQSGTPEEFGIWTQATDDGVPVGGTASATVSIGWWIAEAFAPFSETEDVALPASAAPTMTTISPTLPGSFIAGVQYAIMIDFDSVDTCPVALTASADAYDGGSMVLDEDSVQGNLALRVQYRGDEAEPGPDPDPEYVAPSLSGTPPAGTVGEPYSFQYTVGGSNNPMTALQEGELPPGIAFSEHGELSGTPTQAGTFTPMLKAYDGENASLVVAFIEIRPAATEPDPETPAVIEGAPPAAVQGRPYSYQFDLEGNPPPTASITQGSLPRGLTLSEDALLSGTPTESGTFQARLMADNGVGPAAIIDVEIVVNPSEGAAPAAPTRPAAAAPPARAARSTSAGQTLAKTGVEPAPILMLAAAMLGGAALAGSVLCRRRRPATTSDRGR
jgi:hypothetical protein